MIDNIKSFFEVLGFSFEDFVPVTQLTRFKKIIVPDSSFFSDEEGKRYWTKEYKRMIEIVKSWGKEHIRPTGIDKIYFSYNAKNKTFGEEKLEKFFSAQGYKVIHPEKYSFKEQLNMLLNCKTLAAFDGSCSHNAVFMKEGSKLLLIPRAYYMTGYQLAINDMTRLDIFYIDATLSLYANYKSPWAGPFYFYISENLMRYFNWQPKDKKFWHKNLKDFRRYAKKSRALYRKRFLDFFYQGTAEEFCEKYRPVPPEFYLNVFYECLVKYLYESTFTKLIHKARTFYRGLKKVVKKVIRVHG